MNKRRGGWTIDGAFRVLVCGSLSRKEGGGGASLRLRRPIVPPNSRHSRATAIRVLTVDCTDEKSVATWRGLPRSSAGPDHSSDTVYFRSD